MNERIKELAEQAGITFDTLGASYTYGSLPDFLERFAELVRADEREICAKLCDDLDDDIVDGLAGWQFAAAIRGRTE